MERASDSAEQTGTAPPMRIALVTETFPPEVNGVAMTLGRMLAGLRERGHQVQLLRPRQSRGEQPARRSGYEERLLPGLPMPGYAGLRFGLPATGTLVRLWRAWRPDVVHVATEGPLGWSAMRAARRLGLPLCSDFHTNFDHYSRHYGLGWLDRPVGAYLRRFHNRGTATYVPSRELAARLAQEGYQGVDVIARGVDCELFSPARRSATLRGRWGLAAGTLAVLSVGRLAPEKNLPLVLRAFDAIAEKRPDARLVLVGDGPMRKSLERQRPDVVFAGLRRDQDLAAHYASGDLFLFPSQTETYGNVTLEAMASGLPVVAYDYAAAGELIRPGENGLLAPFGDAGELIRQGVRASLDPPGLAALGQAARRTALRQDWCRIHDAFAAALVKVARRPVAEPGGAVPSLDGRVAAARGRVPRSDGSAAR